MFRAVYFPHDALDIAEREQVPRSRIMEMRARDVYNDHVM